MWQKRLLSWKLFIRAGPHEGDEILYRRRQGHTGHGSGGSGDRQHADQPAEPAGREATAADASN